MVAYQAMKGANEAVRAKVLLIEAVWSRTAIQVEFVKRVAKTLEPRHCRIHVEVFQMLQLKLATAITNIESVVGGSGVTKVKYLFHSNDIDDVIS